MLVIQHKLVDLEYFMYRLEDWEVVNIYQNLSYADNNLWQVGRLIAYFGCLPHLKNKISISEFLPLPTDEIAVKVRKDITDDEIKQMKELSSMMARNMGA